MSIIIFAESIGPVVVTHLPTARVEARYIRDGVRWGEEDVTTLSPVGQVMHRALNFHRTEARHFRDRRMIYSFCLECNVVPLMGCGRRFLCCYGMIAIRRSPYETGWGFGAKNEIKNLSGEGSLVVDCNERENESNYSQARLNEL